MLAEGFTTRRGRRSAYLHRDAVQGRLRARRGARLAALTSGGAIPDTADFDVVLEPEGSKVGTVDEDFAVESLPGDVFQLGNTSWRILRIEQGRVRVEDARGEPPNIPFWFGEMPGRSDELSFAVSRLRREIAESLDVQAGEEGSEGDGETDGENRRAAADLLTQRLPLPREAAEQLIDYLAAGRRALGSVPSQENIVLERFFDQAGDLHLVLHSPFGSRINRAWGLALRKRFCRKFNFELQAAASDNAILLSLGPSHSFPLEEVFRYLSSKSVGDLLIQALLDAPMFGVRWRWNASRSLALPRFRGGRRVPPPIQRQAAEDLVAVVFPDQLACLETIAGDREVPEHPLVDETLQDCLQDAMDLAGLEKILQDLEAGRIQTQARDLTEPSPWAHEILNAMPYAFLDDAPLEERRSRAVLARRWVDPETADDFGSLDAAAVERVRGEARPEARDAEELHDNLVIYGYLPALTGVAESWLDSLGREGRAARLHTPGGSEIWIAAERLDQVQAVFDSCELTPPLCFPERMKPRDWSPEDALVELLRGRLEALGPVTKAALADETDLPAGRIEAALVSLEGEGFILRGSFTGAGEEWCERRLLARIHRYTLNRLRREIEPVDRRTLGRFLLDWHRAMPTERGSGPDSLVAALDRLEGFAAPAAAWETDILPTRVADYEAGWLDQLCLSGRYVWCRPAPPPTLRRATPLRSTPIALVKRENLAALRSPGSLDLSVLSSNAGSVADALREGGASFFSDIVRATGLLATQTEEALAELAARGMVTSDSFAGLRALLIPTSKRPKPSRRAARSPIQSALEGAGRWSLLAEDPPGDEAAEVLARTLLQRYGVVFRALLGREDLTAPWRDLLYCLRRWEARGEVRGGRFVGGFSGEQFALPEAVAALRRNRNESLGRVSVSAADPLNLVGVITPGSRLPALAGNRLLLQDGLPEAFHEGGATRFLSPEPPPDPIERSEAERTLLRQPTPSSLAAFSAESAQKPS